VVKVLCYKTEGRWFDPRWCQWIFLWHIILPIALCPWGQHLTEMSTKSISWGLRRSVRKAENPTPSCAVVTKSGNPNFLESSGPLQVCNGTDLSLPRHQVQWVLIYGCVTKYTNFKSGVIVTHRIVEGDLNLFLKIRFKPQFNRALSGLVWRREKYKLPCSHKRSNNVCCAICCEVQKLNTDVLNIVLRLPFHFLYRRIYPM